MATTVATLRATVIAKIGTGTTANEPTTGQVDAWIREGFREGFTIFQPPFKAASTAISGDAVAVSGADRILYVLVGGLMLIQGEEWQHGASGVTDLPRRYHGQTPTIYYTAVPDLTGSTIESSCVLGDDWLEPFVTLYAVSEQYQRLANTSASHGAQQAGSLLRVSEERRGTLTNLMLQQRNTWEMHMENMLARRAALGPGVLRESPFAGYRNRGRMSNPLTGVGG